MSRSRWWQLLAVLMALGLVSAACGGGSEQDGASGGQNEEAGESDEKRDLEQVGLVFDIGGRGDKSFNDSAVEGMEQAKSEFGFDVKELEPSTGGENREELLRLISEEDFPLIYAIGFAFTDSVTKLAPQFGDDHYVLVDGVPEEEIDNVTSTTFAEEQGSFLVGVAAALKSKSNHIGFVGGVDVPLIKKFEAGYTAGAKAVKPDIEVSTKYLTQPPDFTGFNDPAKGKEAAKGLYAGGADVVYHAAGGSGSGVFDAAVEGSTGGKQLWAIGVDSDQYLTATPAQQKVILTSMIKKVDVAVYETAKAFVAGELEPGVIAFDLESGGVDYSTSGGYIDDIKDQLEDYKKRIIAGDIKVPTEP